MSWTNEMTVMVRALTNDMGFPQKYSDTYIQQVLVTAGILVSQDTSFLANSYEFSVSGITISPDPFDTNDTAAMALFPLKAACILNIGDFQKSLGQGIKVKDGDSAIDTSVGFRGYADILRYGSCEAYKSLLVSINKSLSAGANIGAIISPYRSPSDNPISDLQTFYNNFAYNIGLSTRGYCG